jgi:hypothetical protein
MSTQENYNRNYLCPLIENYKEIDNFDEAIKQHEQYINVIKTSKQQILKRIEELKSAKDKFKCPSEYDDYIKNAPQKLSNEEIEQLMLNEHRNDIIREITNRYNYFWRCVYYDKHVYAFIMDDINLIITPTWNKLKHMSINDLEYFIEEMRKQIITVNVVHNSKLITNSKQKYYCNFCMEPGCDAYPSDGRMSICGSSINFSTEYVDFLNESILDYENPSGYIARH